MVARWRDSVELTSTRAPTPDHLERKLCPAANSYFWTNNRRHSDLPLVSIGTSSHANGATSSAQGSRASNHTGTAKSCSVLMKKIKSWVSTSQNITTCAIYFAIKYTHWLRHQFGEIVSASQVIKFYQVGTSQHTHQCGSKKRSASWSKILFVCKEYRLV